MRSLAIVLALASTALASPAVARDGVWYTGVEGGAMIVQDANFRAASTVNGRNVNNQFKIDHHVGVDADIIGGYDFGFIRAEVEAGYKRASIDQLRFDNSPTIDASGSTRAYSVMGNVMLDFEDNAWAGYVGGGVGAASVRYKIAYASAAGIGSGSDRDRTFAYQAIAGVRRAIGPNVEIGVKYRYFVAPKLNYDTFFGTARTKFRSHSLLASLIYNFSPPPAPIVIEPVAPPPPPPPATQTCVDGSVILATDVCPPPPPPPPPPAPEPAPERG